MAEVSPSLYKRSNRHKYPSIKLRSDNPSKQTTLHYIPQNTTIHHNNVPLRKPPPSNIHTQHTLTRSKHKPLDIITLFHHPTLPASSRALALLQQASATSCATATEDQASCHTHHAELQHSPFQVDVTEEPPTPDQVKVIMDYLGPGLKVADLVEGAKDRLDALRRVKEDGGRFRRPVIVDWNGGRAGKCSFLGGWLGWADGAV